MIFLSNPGLANFECEHLGPCVVASITSIVHIIILSLFHHSDSITKFTDQQEELQVNGDILATTGLTVNELVTRKPMSVDVTVNDGVITRITIL